MKRRDEQGSVLVETTFAIPVLLLLAFGFVTVVQLMWTQVDLSSGVRTATRYAARADYDPGASSPSSRFRTADDIEKWTAAIASEAGVKASDVTVTDNGHALQPGDTVQQGDELVVTITHTVSNPLYQLAASTTNGVAGFFHAGRVFDPSGVTLTAQASTYVE